MADIFQTLNKVIGQATSFGASEYNVSSTTYPSDLLADGSANQYGGNYVIFYINVHEDSLLTKDGTQFVAPANVPARMVGDARGMEVGAAAKTLIGAGAGAGAANAVDVVGKALGAVGGTASKGAKVVGNTILGGVTGAAAVGEVGAATKKYKRMQQAIALHVPTDISIKYGVNWEETNLAGTEAIAAMTEGIAGALEKGKLSSGAKAMKDYLVGAALQTPGAGEFLSKTSGTAANPKKEQLFKSVDFRTFTFSYQFFPRSSEEAKQVQDIIKLFKLHMHPEYKSGNHFLYIYPSEFDIFYYNNGKENMNLHRHTSCVLTDMNISYAPQSIFSTFKDGMPTQINIQMTFRELALLSKESIQDGY